MTRKRLLRWLIILVCVYLIVTTTQSIVDLWRSGDKITRRDRELAALEKEQKELFKEKKRVESVEYLEKMARDKLGLSRPGEETIIIPAELLAQAPVATPDATPNWKKWTRLIF